MSSRPDWDTGGLALWVRLAPQTWEWELGHPALTGKPRVAVYISITPALGSKGMQTSKPLEFAGQPICTNDKLHAQWEALTQKLWWRMTKDDTQRPHPASTYVSTHIHGHTSSHITHSPQKGNNKWHLLSFLPNLLAFIIMLHAYIVYVYNSLILFIPIAAQSLLYTFMESVRTSCI